MNQTTWETYGNPFTVKTRPYDIEKTEIEVVNTTDSVDFSKYDYVYMKGNFTRVYKIKGIRQGPNLKVNGGDDPDTDAAVNGSCIVSLELDALATWYTMNYGHGAPTIYGRWERLPVRSTIEPFQIRPAQMMRDAAVELPRMSETVRVVHPGNIVAGPFPIVFVKITGLLSQVLTTLYFIIPVDDTLVGPQTSGLSRDSGGNRYPSLFQVINFTGQITGMNTAEIVDVSVSQFCPFDYSVGSMGDTSNYVQLTGQENWSHIYTIEWNGVEYSGTVHGYIDKTPVGASKTVTVQTPITAAEPGVCQIALKNAEGNIVQAIDTRFTEWDAIAEKYVLNMTYTCYISTSGIMSMLTLSDGSIIEWSEGHLPYNSSKWNDYVLSERNYDREMNMIQRDKAQYDLMTGALSSLANGAFTASFSKTAAVGTSGLSMIGGIFDYMGGEMVREREQSAKDSLMKAAPNTVYSDAYGIGYLIKMLNGEHNAIVVMRPSGITDAEISAYISAHGYPVTDYSDGITMNQLATATRGYIKAKMINTATFYPSLTGEWFRLLDKQLREGVLFKVS